MNEKGAKLFKLLRLQLHLTQRDLAKELGTSQTTIYYHELGKFFNVSIIKKLLTMTGNTYTLEDFFIDY